MLAGRAYLQDISHSGHPLDQDQSVAHAWTQPGWADYSGVSRTLQGSWALFVLMSESEEPILYLKQLYPPIHYREIVRIVARKFGYKTNHHTVKGFLTRHLGPRAPEV